MKCNNSQAHTIQLGIQRVIIALIINKTQLV